MGVNGLWTVVQPCARPTNLATLNRKRLAVDASIWIYQFLKAVRDKEGNALRNSHVVGFFRRICKLLWYGIQPVFVFDGGAPALKRATLQGRRQRREGRREDAARTAGKLLAVQMQRMAEEEEDKRKRRVEAAKDGPVEEEQEELPDMSKIVYADELGMSNQERQRSRRFHKQDAYHLPELHTSIDGMGKPDDPRIMSVEELEEYAKQFQDGEDINLYDFSKIDFDGEFFKSLPPADRYNILNAARIRSRLRMGLSKEQLDEMFPDRMAFSRFQIERVQERNKLTQRLMYEMGMTGTDLTLAANGARVAGERNREYILVKNEGAEGGWALGVVSREKDVGKIHKPIDVDAVEFQYQAADQEAEEFDDEDFEDVPIEGLNRLPKLRSNQADQQEADESLFVDDDDMVDLFEDDVVQDEEEDLRRAIAMSLESQHRKPDTPEPEEEFEDVPAPQWTQKAVEAPKPIVSTSGRMVAHIVNNRANAVVPRRRESSSSSDSDMDLQTALASAREKKKSMAPRKQPDPVRPNVRDPFDGPLPFEKLEWGSMFSKPQVKTTPKEQPKKQPQAETGELEAVSEDEGGGFIIEPESPESETQDAVQADDAPRPLPPWLQDSTDIRDSLRMQQQIDEEMNAEDEELAQDMLLRRRQAQFVEIGSSSGEDSDIEILDAPPPPRPKRVTFEEPGDSLPSMDDINTNPTPAPDTAASTVPARSPSPEIADESFEDVPITVPSITLTLPRQMASQQPVTISATQEAEAAQIEAELFGDDTTQDGFDPGEIDPDAPGPEEFDDFSDPEEEELLAQMAEEAEEHARFASQLNNKSQRENQEAYEQELRALRTQQKKDRRDADEVTQIMVTECQALLKLFGIPYITAPMEAEAQCAELVRLNLVDGIVTDDSDTFLFGGTRVYKNMFNSNKFVECYLAKDLETELSLSREQLISLAQLLGSDYTEGLSGVGPVTAVEILSEFPGKDGLEAFRDWWDDVQKHGRPKEADADSAFRRKFRKSQATKLFLPLGFPSPAVFEAYMKPEVDSNTEKFQWGVPDLDGLRQFLMATIGWGQERTDEVLVPVIRDMNRRAVEGTQSNITRYFEGSVGTGAAPKEAFAPRQRAKGSKRMAEAVSKLRAKSGGLSTRPVVVCPPEPKKKRRRVVEEEDAEEDGEEDHASRGRGKARARGRKAKV
ncbi:DNA repair protein rad13 [Echria macrotheca]|uniref:DNA repair protein rad13 n=1 Tax=Echria macrotheca TaxID=438768 RepID=A0AAJ0FB82_9PEZI|nr:DNA repair protein rad13 [Echria macrotheca]